MKINFKDKYFIISVIITFVVSYIPINEQTNNTMMLGFPFGFFKINIPIHNENLSFHFNPLAFIANVFIFFCLLKIVIYIKGNMTLLGKEKQNEK